MIAYLFLWIIPLLEIFFRKKLIVSFFYAFLVYALRYFIGWDYYAYYYAIISGLETNITSRSELITNWLVSKAQIMMSPKFYFVTNATISFLLIYKVLKDSGLNNIVSYISLIGIPLFYLNFMSVTRMFPAIAIVFFTFHNEFKWYKRVILIVLASQFHKSALFSLVFLFVPSSNSKRNIFYSILQAFTLTFAMEVIVKVLFNQYSVYLMPTTAKEGRFTIIIFLAIGIFSLVTYSYKKNVEIECNNVAHSLNIFIFSVVFYLLNISKGTVGHRLSLYGTINLIYFFPCMIKQYVKKDRLFLTFLTYVFFFVLFFLTLKIGKRTYIPYEWH